MSYKPGTRDEFLLYAFGPDEKDNGGDAGPDPADSTRYNFPNSRDLVWPRPASAEDITASEAREKRRR